ncbi:MAG TPA: sensor histidine kinase, partial [Methylophilaceae bacterium]|nr:sensor histidine kinase [Methylophilaceae bacterium]
VTSDWVPKALEKHIDLGLSCTLSQCLISGNNMLLQELINNLLDNAIRYNPAGTKVTASLKVMNQEVILAVQDDGIGIATNEQQKVFERFYRVLGNTESGCGLGLAIVREIALQHHARVELAYRDIQHAQGTAVKVIFTQL